MAETTQGIGGSSWRPGDVLAPMRRFKVVSIVCILGTLAIAGLLYVLTPATYSSAVDVMVTPTIRSASDQQVRSDQLVNMDTEMQVAQSQTLQGQVAKRLGTAVVSKLALSVEALPSSSVLQITLKAPTARESKDAATAFAETYLANRVKLAEQTLADTRTRLDSLAKPLEDQITATNLKYQAAKAGSSAALLLRAELDSRLAQLRQVRAGIASLDGSVLEPGVVTNAAEDGKPNKLPLWIYLTGGLLLGLGLAAAVTYLLETRDPLVRSVDDLNGVPLGPLVVIGGASRSRSRRLAWQRLRSIIAANPALVSILVCPATDDDYRTSWILVGLADAMHGDSPAPALMTMHPTDGRDADAFAPAALPGGTSGELAERPTEAVLVSAGAGEPALRPLPDMELLAGLGFAEAPAPANGRAGALEAETRQVIGEVAGARRELRLIEGLSPLTEEGEAALGPRAGVILVIKLHASRREEVATAVGVCDQHQSPVLATVLVRG